MIIHPQTPGDCLRMRKGLVALHFSSVTNAQGSVLRVYATPSSITGQLWKDCHDEGFQISSRTGKTKLKDGGGCMLGKEILPLSSIKSDTPPARITRDRLSLSFRQSTKRLHAYYGTYVHIDKQRGIGDRQDLTCGGVGSDIDGVVWWGLSKENKF